MGLEACGGREEMGLEACGGRGEMGLEACGGRGEMGLEACGAHHRPAHEVRNRYQGAWVCFYLCSTPWPLCRALQRLS